MTDAHRGYARTVQSEVYRAGVSGTNPPSRSMARRWSARRARRPRPRPSRDDGSVLVASRPGSLLEVDPVTLETLDEVSIQGDVMSLIPDGDRVIITRNNADRLSTIDPGNLAAGENLIDEARISSFTLTADDAWGIDWQTGDILRLDRDALTIVERMPALSEGQDGISVVAGDLWVGGTNEDGPVVHRVRAP